MQRRTVWLVMLACAVPRVLALAIFRNPARTLYLSLAENLALRHRYVVDDQTTSYIEPFYPLVLALARFVSGGALWPLLVAQIAIACAGGAAMFALARARTGNDRVAWVAALLYAASPYLVRQSASFMEVTVATALAIGVAWRLDRIASAGAAVVAGLLLAALVLTRFSFLPVAAGALVIVWRRAGAVPAAIVAAVTVAALTPWLAFSRAAGGTLLPPRIGENLFVSTSGWTAGIVPRVNVDVLLPPAEELVRRELGDSYSLADRDRVLFRHALDYVAAHPVLAARLKLTNLACVLLPRLLPFTERRGRADIVGGEVRIPPQAARPLPFEIAAAAFQALLIVGTVAGVRQRRYDLAGDAVLILVAASVVAVNVLFFPTSRLLAPMTFVLMFYSAVSLVG
jgi:hypothetical protein